MKGLQLRAVLLGLLGGAALLLGRGALARDEALGFRAVSPSRGVLGLCLAPVSLVVLVAFRPQLGLARVVASLRVLARAHGLPQRALVGLDFRVGAVLGLHFALRRAARALALEHDARVQLGLGRERQRELLAQDGGVVLPRLVVGRVRRAHVLQFEAAGLQLAVARRRELLRDFARAARLPQSAPRRRQVRGVRRLPLELRLQPRSRRPRRLARALRLGQLPAVTFLLLQILW